MVTVGLMFIVAGWYLQLASAKKKKFVLRKNFLLLYAIGSGLLTLYSLGGFGIPTVLNAASALFAFLIYRKMGK
jgi:hypothetical protein